MQKVLIADDEEINRTALYAGLCDLFELVETSDGEQTLKLLYGKEDISAVLLDLRMPGMDGYEVLKVLNATGTIEKVPVMVITAADDNEDLLKAYDLGAVDVITKPYNVQFLRRRLSNTIELYQQRNRLSEIVEEKTRELMRQNNRLVEAMADIVEFRNNESGTHVKRVKGYTRILMEGIVRDYNEYGSLKEDIENIAFAACLHDLGKISVSDQILNKPGKLNAEEFNSMKVHSLNGYEQILALRDIMAPKLFDYSLDIARHHHERYDGTGYPDGLKGDEISIWAQVVGLADVYDALTTQRCYKKAYDHQKACQMIFEGECGQFNPKVVAVFKKLNEKCNEFRLQNPDN